MTGIDRADSEDVFECTDRVEIFDGVNGEEELGEEEAREVLNAWVGDQNYCHSGDVCCPKTLEVRLKQAKCRELAGLNMPEACRGRRPRGRDQRQRDRARFPGLVLNVEDAYA